MEIDDGRHYSNPFGDFKSDSQDFTKPIEPKICQALPQLLSKLLDGLNTIDMNNITVYTGVSGVAYALWLLSRKPNLPFPSNLSSTQLLKIAKELVCAPDVTSSTILDGKPSFINGSGGFVIVRWLLGLDSQNELLNKWLQHQEVAVAHSRHRDDEILVGNAGLLQCLLLLKQHNVSQVDPLIHKVVNVILTAGQRGLSGGDPPLMFEWHGKQYLGAAHGLAGIIYMLLSAHQICPGSMDDKQLKHLVRPTLEWLREQRYRSGNYFSSVGTSSGDKLVHWCHGAPGVIHAFLKGYEVFQDAIFLKWAEECSEVIWCRGLLQKGYGLCHGAAGNAYSFLTMYRITQEPRYLYRAWKFAEWCSDYGKHGCRTADRPFSLFEGLAGTVCFLADVCTLHEAHFPGFELVR